MSKLYIKHCCYFCTEREVNCKGCLIAKEGIAEIRNKCHKYLEAGVCTNTFGDAVNKNMCFVPDDKDTEVLDKKSTSKLSLNDKEEGEKKEKPKKSKEERSTQEDKVVLALKEAAKNGDIDFNSLLEKLKKGGAK